MVLVLLVVPALMAMQQDVGRQSTALRRALTGGGQASSLRVLTGASALVITSIFVATMGHVIFAGTLPEALIALAPPLSDAPQMAAAFALFVLGSAVVAMLAFGLGVLWFGRRSSAA